MSHSVEERLLRLEQSIGSIFRVGIVSARSSDSDAIQVAIGSKATYKLPVLVPRSQGTKIYSLPEIGEQVLCIFLPPGFSRGFVLGSFFSATDKPPEHCEGWSLECAGSTRIRVDKESGQVLIETSGEIQCKAKSIHWTAGEAKISSALTLEGSLTVKGVANDITLSEGSISALSVSATTLHGQLGPVSG
jgi:phage baseplate assembly protein V